MKTLILDGDELLFWMAFGRVRMEERARERIGRWLERTGCDRYVVCLGCRREDNFRRQFLPTYKSKPGSEKPPAYPDAVAALTGGLFTTRSVPNLEADDVLGLLMTCPGMKGDRVMVGKDKDFKTIPGTRYNPETGVTIEHTKRTAYHAHMVQTLMGDKNDGYDGIPGIGEVKAKKILGGNEDAWWGAVVGAYERAGMTVTDAITQARCAKILTWDCWDEKNSRPIPWTPPYGVLAEAVA